MRLRVGRIRKRLSEMLAAHGLLIEPQHLQTQDGPLYRNPGNDLARWDGLAHWKESLIQERGLVCHLSSWDKMADCVRFGFELSPDKYQGWRYADVTAKETSR